MNQQGLPIPRMIRFSIQYFEVLLLLCDQAIEDPNNPTINRNKPAQDSSGPLYIALYVVNKDQLSCYYYAGYNYDDLPFETKLLFNNLMALFEYISANRHSERVKLTKKGNLIVELPIKDRVEQCRLITKRIAANIDLDQLEKTVNKLDKPQTIAKTTKGDVLALVQKKGILLKPTQQPTKQAEHQFTAKIAPTQMKPSPMPFRTSQVSVNRKAAQILTNVSTLRSQPAVITKAIDKRHPKTINFSTNVIQYTIFPTMVMSTSRQNDKEIVVSSDCAEQQGQQDHSQANERRAYEQMKDQGQDNNWRQRINRKGRGRHQDESLEGKQTEGARQAWHKGNKQFPYKDYALYQKLNTLEQLCSQHKRQFHEEISRLNNKFNEFLDIIRRKENQAEQLKSTGGNLNTKVIKIKQTSVQTATNVSMLKYEDKDEEQLGRDQLSQEQAGTVTPQQQHWPENRNHKSNKMRYAEVQRKDLIDRKAPNNERQIIPPTIISKKKNRHISDNDKYNPERSYLHHKISQEQYEKISSEQQEPERSFRRDNEEQEEDDEDELGSERYGLPRYADRHQHYQYRNHDDSHRAYRHEAWPVDGQYAVNKRHFTSNTSTKQQIKTEKKGKKILTEKNATVRYDRYNDA